MVLPLVAPLENIIRRCKQEGIPVIEWGGPHPVTGKTVKWREMTMPYSVPATPVGLLDHHTAPPVPYPIDKLAKACNYSIRHPDGAVVLMNAGIAYDSGNGDRKVLDAVVNDRSAPAPSDTYTSTGAPGGTNPGISGTKWYIDVEVMHLGDGSPLLPVMRRSLIVANAALCEHMGFDPRFRLLGHREWTRRKIDPRWDGFVNPMPSIRVDVAAQLAAWEGTDMWSKKLDEAGWRQLWRAGFAMAASEAEIVDYWWTKRASRTDAEHRDASENMTASIAVKLARQAGATRGVEPQFQAAWAWAEAQGYTSAGSDPDDLVTKEELMVFLQRALEGLGSGGYSKPDADKRFAPKSAFDKHVVDVQTDTPHS